MEISKDLSRREVLVLREVRLTGRTTAPSIAQRLSTDELLVLGRDGRMRLTAKGRSLLVRGSPSLWDIAA